MSEVPSSHNFIGSSLFPRVRAVALWIFLLLQLKMLSTLDDCQLHQAFLYTPIIQLCNSLKQQSPKYNSGSSPENISTSGALPRLIGVEANILPVVFISPSHSEYVVFSGIDNTPDLKSSKYFLSCSISLSLSIKVLSNSDNL